MLAVEDSISGVSSALEAGCFVFFLKENSDAQPKKEFFEQSKNLKEINHLKEIETILSDY